MDKLKEVQWRATGVAKSWNIALWRERLKRPCSPAEEVALGSLFPQLQGSHEEDWVQLGSVVCGRIVGDNKHKLKPWGFRGDVRRSILPWRESYIRTGCPESLHPCKFLKPKWIKPWAAWSALIIADAAAHIGCSSTTVCNAVYKWRSLSSGHL